MSLRIRTGQGKITYFDSIIKNFEITCREIKTILIRTFHGKLELNRGPVHTDSIEVQRWLCNGEICKFHESEYKKEGASGYLSYHRINVMHDKIFLSVNAGTIFRRHVENEKFQ